MVNGESAGCAAHKVRRHTYPCAAIPTGGLTGEVSDQRLAARRTAEPEHGDLVGIDRDRTARSPSEIEMEPAQRDPVSVLGDQLGRDQAGAMTGIDVDVDPRW